MCSTADLSSSFAWTLHASSGGVVVDMSFTGGLHNLTRSARRQHRASLERSLHQAAEMDQQQHETIETTGSTRSDLPTHKWNTWRRLDTGAPQRLEPPAPTVPGILTDPQSCQKIFGAPALPGSSDEPAPTGDQRLESSAEGRNRRAQQVG